MRVQWVGYGRPAAEALRASIAAAKGDEPLRPVTVVVPSNHVGVAVRRLLASGRVGPVCERGIGIAAVTFVTVNRLAEILGGPLLAMSGRRPLSPPVIAAALRSALADNPGVFGAVAAHPATETALVAAYRELRDLPTASLDAIAATSRSTADVVRLVQSARARLQDDWYDEEDLLEAARTLSPVSASEPVIVYLPQRLSLHAVALLLDMPDLTVIAGSTGDEAADAEVGSPWSGWEPVPTRPAATRVISTSDADEEVRAAVRTIVGAARDGTPLDRMAFLYPGAEPYGRLVHEQLGAAGIAANGPSVVPLKGRAAGRLLLALLALPGGGFRRQDVFAWMSVAPLRHRSRPAPITAWERISREAGVVAGRRDWDLRLARWALEQDTLALAEDSPRARMAADDAARARALRSFVLGLIDDLAAAAGRPRRWGEHARWARHQLERLVDGVSEGWPAAELAAAERVQRALDRLAALEGVEGPIGLDVFGRTFELELEADLGRVGRFGEGVFVGPVSMGVGLDLDLVVVLGMVEGTFPSPVREDSLLPDTARAASGALPLRRDHVHRQHRWLLASLAGAGRRLVGVPRGDLRRSRAAVPSRWVPTEGASAESVSSYAGGLAAVTFPATAQEHRLRTGLADPGLVRPLPGAEVMAARRSADFTRFDGNLAGLPVPGSDETTATRLERWVRCPFEYFMVDVLGVTAADYPEDHLQIPPVVRGELVHAALEQFVTEVLERPASEQPGPDDPWTDDDRKRMIAIAEDLCTAYEERGLTGRELFWRRDATRIVANLVQFLDVDSAFRAARRTRIVAAEQPFRAAEFPLGDGRVVRFRGKVDRVDVGPDGGAVVLDYKTGRANGYSRLSRDNPDDGGARLQLPIYAAAFGGVGVEALYWFVSAGVEPIGYSLTDSVVATVGSHMAVVVDGIAAGVFPNHPTEASSSRHVACQYCDPDRLGVTELRRAWERKRSSFRAYAEMVEPSDAG